MKVRIHGGAQTIGGNCVEVEHEGSHIVLDVGRPLDADGEVPLPEVSGFRSHDAGLLGVLISHGHQDHWGLAGQLPDEVPLYMGEATHRILSEAEFWTKGLSVKPERFFEDQRPFAIGPFKITPYLVDHSAYGAFALLVEAGGRRLFYTGDFSGQGRKRALFYRFLRKAPTNIDVLMMEGTNIRPGNDPFPKADCATEDDVENELVAHFQATKGMALVSHSSQNVDRLVTIYRAAKRSDRTLAMDIYTASIMKATGNPSIPQPGADWALVRVFVVKWQRDRIEKTGQEWRLRQIKPCRVFKEELARTPEKFVASTTWRTALFLANAGALEGAQAVWSMWPGYLDRDSDKKLGTFLAERGIPRRIVHASGHASMENLQAFAEAVGPRRLVPIHTSDPGGFSDLFDNVEVHADTSWWDV